MPSTASSISSPRAPKIPTGRWCRWVAATLTKVPVPSATVAGTGGASTIVCTAWAFTRSPGFHSDGRNFDDWRMGQAGFRTDRDVGTRDTFTFQGDIYREIAGETTQYA